MYRLIEPPQLNFALDLFQAEDQIRRDGSLRFETDARLRRGESTAQKNARRFVIRKPRLKDVIEKALEPVAKKAVVSRLQTQHQMSERRACRLIQPVEVGLLLRGARAR